MVRSVYPTTAR